MAKNRKLRKTLLWLMLATLFAGLVWAADQLLNQADSNVQQAASIGADDEMATITATSVKPEKKDNIAWSQIKRYENQLKQNTTQYHALLQKANSEKQANNGAVTDATRQQGLDSANKFNEISEQLAATWQKGNCITRAKAVRSAGKSRIANAEMAFNSLDSSNINNYNKQRSDMGDANVESLQEIKGDSSAADIAALKANLIPQLNKMISDNTRLLSQITQLLDQIRRAAGGDVSAMAGCAKGVLTGASQGGPGGLLQPVMALLDMVKNMGSNLATTLKAVTTL